MIAGMLQLFTSDRCLEHDLGPAFPEVPARLRGILDRVAADGLAVVEVEGYEGARGAVEAVHEARYLERFERAVERGDGLLDSADNPLRPTTWSAAWGAVESALRAADWVMEGAGRTAFAAIRPPGHHAERALAMGFCFFNNVAVAAQHLRDHHGVERVAIFDFDVHHGNGTQHLFEQRADVFFASVHQFPFYPGTGAEREIGIADGRGATLNVPLPAGSGDAAYEAAFAERVLPGLRAFGPQVLLLSAGFDAWRGDPLGGMRVTAEGFRRWGELLGELAAEHCEGRVLAVLEGGYDLAALGELVSVHLSALSGGVGESAAAGASRTLTD